MSAGFTRGPWVLREVADLDIAFAIQTDDARPIPIADSYTGPTMGVPIAEAEANARLIAAAPELYEMLAMFVDAAKPRGPDGFHEMPRFSAKEIALAKDALAKATQATGAEA